MVRYFSDPFAYFRATLDMNKGFTTCLVILGVVQDVIGSVHNSPCKRTEECSEYRLQCFSNQRIHIKRHVIEDGFNRLQFPDLGCSIKDALYCGTDLPKNSTIDLQNGVFVNAVKQCNGQTQCSLDKNYFAKAEKRVRDSCSASPKPDLQKAKFRQSIEYECIRKSEIMDMCTTFGVNWSQPIYLETSGNGTARNCSCHITGSPSLVEILQIISVRVQILSHDSYILDHQNYPLGIYGMAIPISADSLTLTLVDVSNESLALIKIVGNVLVECNEKKVMENKNIRRAFQEHNSLTTLNTESSYSATLTSKEPNTKNPELSSLATVETAKVMEKRDPMDIFQTSLITLLCFLMVFVLLTNWWWRTRKNNTVEISIENVRQRFFLECQSSQENRPTKIEIHKADCMCDRSKHVNRQSTIYTPLQIEDEVTYSTTDTNEYLDVTQ